MYAVAKSNVPPKNLMFIACSFSVVTLIDRLANLVDEVMAVKLLAKRARLSSAESGQFPMPAGSIRHEFLARLIVLVDP